MDEDPVMANCQKRRKEPIYGALDTGCSCGHIQEEVILGALRSRALAKGIAGCTEVTASTDSGPGLIYTRGGVMHQPRLQLTQDTSPGSSVNLSPGSTGGCQSKPDFTRLDR